MRSRHGHLARHYSASLHLQLEPLQRKRAGETPTPRWLGKMSIFGNKPAAVFVSVLLVLATVVHAQTTHPANSQGRFENDPILQSGTTSSMVSSTTQPAESMSTASQLDMGRVVLALGIVLAVIFTMRWAGRKFFPNAAAPRSTGAMKVLSRLVVSPKQQLLMIQVGRRIVVVGDAGGQMSAISQITDVDEVAALIGQVTEEKSLVSMKAFGALFHREGERFEPSEIQNVPPHPEGSRAGSPNEDGVIESARGEIDELADKVRLLSAQFQGK